MAQEPFKVLKWAELAALAGLRSAQLQLAIVPRLCFKSKNGCTRLCSETNCASNDKTYSLICKNRLTLPCIHLKACDTASYFPSTI